MKATRYAQRTTVPVMKTRMEIDQLLVKHGCLIRAVLERPGLAVVGFEKDGRRVRFEMPLSHLGDGLRADQARVDREQREQWRALLLALKSKFVSIETGIETFEEAFLAHVVMPNNQRVGELVLPQLEDSYRSGSMPPLLGPGEGRR